MPERMSVRENSRSSPLRRSYSHSPILDRKRRERSPTRSRSRSRSRSVRRMKKYASRSRSRSMSPRRRSPNSRSPYAARGGGGGGRGRGPQDQRPRPCRCLGVFGLNGYTDENKIRDIFEKFGPIERVQMVIDAQSGRSRGFCFVYFDDVADARVAKDKCNGLEIDGRNIRVDYSITQRPHTPTPGRYMGNRRGGGGGGRRGGDDRRRRYERSRSRSYGRYERSRSRSYSPRDRRRSDRRYR